MCGICGFWKPGSRPDEGVISGMAQTLQHRGPDDAGIWIDRAAGLALGHRRLSVLDLSPAGHQPMRSACGRFVLVFNGEIYNHTALRNELESLDAAPAWRGHADTETILAAVSHWGVEKTLKRLVGMFALALWDCSKQSLVLARDRMGEKPLYYGWQGHTFLFGSELKALRAHPDFQGQINRSVLPLLFRHGYISGQQSIYTDIHKILPGQYAVISHKPSKIVKTISYWSLAEVVAASQQQQNNLSLHDAVSELDALLRQAIRGQIIADVPVGAFLSGGIDSSTIVALMQAESSRPVKTFSIGFTEAAYNEAVFAKKIAEHLGTEHTELYVSPSQALDVIPTLPEIYDEPFADSSQIPTFLVAQLARHNVTVSLSGDGGDELFGGYTRYSLVSQWYKRLRPLPGWIRPWLARLLNHFPVGQKTHTVRRKEMLLDLLNAREDVAFYHALGGHWLPGDGLVHGGFRHDRLLDSASLAAGTQTPVDTAMLVDALAYLPDDILVKVDRAAMSVSLETRIPLLDHRVVEWAWGLPQTLKSAGGHHKKVLREVLYRYVPKHLVDRPKMGFGVPLGDWLRGPLREWAEELLRPDLMREQGYLNPQPVQQKWQEHLRNEFDWQYLLWDVLMFQAWLQGQT